jgi:hypothetical protein
MRSPRCKQTSRRKLVATAQVGTHTERHAFRPADPNPRRTVPADVGPGVTGRTGDRRRGTRGAAGRHRAGGPGRSREHCHCPLRTGRRPHHQPAPGHPHLGPGGPAVKPIDEVLQSTAGPLGRARRGSTLTWQSWPTQRRTFLRRQVRRGPNSSPSGRSSRTSSRGNRARWTAPACPSPPGCSATPTRGTSGGAWWAGSWCSR